MKKFLKLAIGATLTLAMLTACGSSSDDNNSTGGGEGNSDYKIGIVQYADVPALDLARDGFINELIANGIDASSIEVQNAQGEQPNCATIATKFVNDQVDLILAIATPAAQAVAQATSDIPILATAITDFEVAGLTASNISGTSDMNPIAEQINLLYKIVPDAKTVGILYSSNEDNSVLQAGIAIQELEKLGIEAQIFTVADSNEIQQVTQSMVGKVDAVYIPTDNIIASAIPTVILVTEPAKIPVIVAEVGGIASGGLATYGLDYEKLGAQTGKQAVKILLEGADIASMPVEFSPEEDLSVSLNEEAFEKLGLEIPADLK